VSRFREAGPYLDALAGAGWFEGLPAGAVQAARDGVASALSAHQEPWVGLVCATPDSEYLLEDLPYTALLLQFAAASHGAFQPEAIREDTQPGAVRLSFRAAGREFARELPADAFDVPDSFFDTINDALKASGSPLRFLQIHDLGWGPIPGFTLVTPQAFRKAAAARLVASEDPSGDFTEEELEGFTATLTMAMMGRETYYWTIGGLTLLEMRVPGSFDAEDSDVRGKGDGLQTVLGYADVGTIILQVAEPIGAHLGIPKEFKVRERSERDDRLVQGGTARLERQEMAWRSDSIKGTPIHATYCVRKALEAPFVEALDSIRVFEPSPETEALYQSCLAPPAAKKSKKKPGRKGR
jgi:hypothetical protein